MTDLVLALVALAALIVLPLLAVGYGIDSREEFTR